MSPDGGGSKNFWRVAAGLKKDDNTGVKNLSFILFRILKESMLR